MRKGKIRKNNSLLRKLITQLETNICSHKTILAMKQTFLKTDYKIQAFSINRVIFDDSDLVSLTINCRLQDELKSTTLLFTFSKFNDLLRLSGEVGEKLQLLVSDKLLGSSDNRPHIIDLTHQPLVFSVCQLELSHLIDEDDTCYSVEEILPLSYLQQAKNLRANVRDFNHVQLDNRKQFTDTLQEISAMYRYYLGLKELKVNENIAREKAGLLNDKLFKMAYCASFLK